MIRMALNLDQNDACSILTFLQNFVKAGLTHARIYGRGLESPSPPEISKIFTVGPYLLANVIIGVKISNRPTLK